MQWVAGGVVRSVYFGQTEVEDFCAPACRNKNICGLDISVNDALAVGGIEGVCDVDGKRHASREIERASGNFVLQSPAIQVLHGKKGLPFILTDVVDRADVGMIECGGSLGFAAKTFQGLAVLRYAFRQEFQSNKAVEARVLGLVDHSHASAAEFFEDTIV